VGVAVDRDPVFGAVVVDLQRQTFTGRRYDPFDLERLVQLRLFDLKFPNRRLFCLSDNQWAANELHILMDY
jgi:hypothetical protein